MFKGFVLGSYSLFVEQMGLGDSLKLSTNIHKSSFLSVPAALFTILKSNAFSSCVEHCIGRRYGIAAENHLIKSRSIAGINLRDILTNNVRLAEFIQVMFKNK